MRKNFWARFSRRSGKKFKHRNPYSPYHSVQSIHSVGGTKIEVGTKFKVDTKIEKSSIVINAEINVAVKKFCLINAAIKFSWTGFPRGGAFPGSHRLKFYCFMGLSLCCFLCVFSLLQTQLFGVSASWLLGFIHVKYFYLMKVKV